MYLVAIQSYESCHLGSMTFGLTRNVGSSLSVVGSTLYLKGQGQFFKWRYK